MEQKPGELSNEGARVRSLFKEIQIDEEGGKDLELLEIIIKYLETRVEKQPDNLAFLEYEEEEVKNREVLFEDGVLVLTMDSVDEESGESTGGVWIK